MVNFLDTFPKVLYDLSSKKSFNITTDITFRIGFIKGVLSNASSYYEYVIRDGETPETLAERFYRDPESYWIILYANEILDPQYDWPLNYQSFKNYIVNTYGSLEYAKITEHHYEKIIEQQNLATGEIFTNKYIIGEDNILDVAAPNLNIVKGSFYNELEEEADWSEFSVNGKPFRQRIFRRKVFIYDYEEEKNENKREIKIIKEEYYPQIVDEFRSLTKVDRLSLRRLT